MRAISPTTTTEDDAGVITGGVDSAFHLHTHTDYLTTSVLLSTSLVCSCGSSDSSCAHLWSASFWVH